MYLIPIEARVSEINGRGVFTLEKIPKGKMVWKYVPEHDSSMSVEEFNNLNEESKMEIDRIAYLSTVSNKYIYPPEGDPARFTNHSKDNNLTVVFDKGVSEEPLFMANRDIEIGEELTNNYLEFDPNITENQPEWI